MIALARTRRYFLLGAIAALALACSKPPVPVADAAGAIAMPDRFSADAVQQVLERGGNAVDAAVAASFVLAVTYPEAGNIAGGGFLLARIGGDAVFLDYRETAPAAATRDMYLDAAGSIVEGLSLNGHRAVGVPGTVAGLEAAHRKYGSLPWPELLEPAIALAENGFAVPQQLVDHVRDDSARLSTVPGFMDHFGKLHAE